MRQFRVFYHCPVLHQTNSHVLESETQESALEDFRIRFNQKPLRVEEELPAYGSSESVSLNAPSPTPGEFFERLSENLKGALAPPAYPIDIASYKEHERRTNGRK